MSFLAPPRPITRVPLTKGRLNQSCYSNVATAVACSPIPCRNLLARHTSPARHRMLLGRPIGAPEGASETVSLVHFVALGGSQVATLKGPGDPDLSAKEVPDCACAGSGIDAGGKPNGIARAIHNGLEQRKPRHRLSTEIDGVRTEIRVESRGFRHGRYQQVQVLVGAEEANGRNRESCSSQETALGELDGVQYRPV